MIRLTKFIFLFVLVTISTLAKSQNWLWDKSSSPPSGISFGSNVDADQFGNVYYAGQFGDTTIHFGATTLTNADSGSYDIFIAKYDVNGNTIWAKSAGGIYRDWAHDLKTNLAGNVFVTGTFYSPSITFGSTTFTNAGNNNGDVFLAKYDASGNVLWARSAGGTSFDDAKKMTVDAAGNIYITGNFQSPTITFGTFTLTNSGVGDFFVVKYDTNGNVIWAHNAPGTGFDSGEGIDVDNLGNLFVAGRFESPTITFGATVLSNNGMGNIFVTRYDTAGNIIWAKSAGGTNYDLAFDLCADHFGNAFVTGYYKSPTITFGSNTYTFGGIFDLFLVKYDANGNIPWSKGIGGTGAEIGYSVATDAVGNVYMSGHFGPDSIVFFNHTLQPPPGGIHPLFVVEFDPTGEDICASALINAASYPNEMAVAADQVYICGGACGDITTDADTVIFSGAITLTYLTKFACDTTTLQIGELKNENEIILYPNPSSGIFTIHRSEISPAEIIVTDLLGKIIYTAPILNSDTEINLSDKAKGIYLYRIFSDNEIVSSGKLIVE